MRVLQRYALVAMALAVLGAIAYLRSVPPGAAKATSGENVIAFGDSLIAGRGASTGNDLVSLLSARLDRRIINAGRSGDTTAAALGRLERDVLSRSPRVVLVLLGGNDFLRRVPREDTFRNMAAIVERIRQRGASVIVVGVSVGVFSDPYGDAYEELARRASAGIVRDILGDVIGRADLMSDAIHPNDRGYAIMADRLEPVLRAALDD